MAFNNNPGKQQFSATSGQTDFDFNFAIFEDTDLKVYKTASGATPDDAADILTITTDYTVSINSNLGGTVTLVSGATTNDTITIVRDLPITRTTDYVTNGDLYADTLDTDQDYQTYLALDMQERWKRSIILPDSYGGVINMPAPSALSLVRWNSAEDGFENINPYELYSGIYGYVVNSVSELSSIDSSFYTMAIVKDTKRGGIFKHESSGTADNGIIFNGDSGVWVRQYEGMVNLNWYEVGSDTLDTSAFSNASNLGKAVFVPNGTYNITSEPLHDMLFILDKGAVVTYNSATWYPRSLVRLGSVITSDKYNDTASDDSPAITGSEYPISTTAPVEYKTLRNFWGAQATDLNDPTKGRTGIDNSYRKVIHYGEGDCYVHRANASITRHSRYASITSVKGHNNTGMYNGQVTALSDQVTLYGIGDAVLKDGGYDNVALRGMTLLMYADGADTYGYSCDRFGHLVYSLGANDIDGAFIARGKMRAGIDTSGATLSDDSAMNMATGQKIFFGASGASQSTGYVADTLGAYWIGNLGSYVEIGSNGGALKVHGTYTEFVPSASSAIALRAYSVTTPTSYIGIGQVGNTGYVTSASDGTDNTTLSFRTSNAGTEQNAMTINQNGTANLPISGARLQIESTNVLGARKTGWAAATGTATRTTFATSTATTQDVAERLKALIDDLLSHGLIGA